MGKNKTILSEAEVDLQSGEGTDLTKRLQTKIARLSNFYELMGEEYSLSELLSADEPRLDELLADAESRMPEIGTPAIAEPEVEPDVVDEFMVKPRSSGVKTLVMPTRNPTTGKSTPILRLTFKKVKKGLWRSVEQQFDSEQIKYFGGRGGCLKMIRRRMEEANASSPGSYEFLSEGKYDFLTRAQQLAPQMQAVYNLVAKYPDDPDVKLWVELTEKLVPKDQFGNAKRQPGSSHVYAGPMRSIDPLG